MIAEKQATSMSDFTNLDATHAALAINRGELDAENLVRACLVHIAALEPRIRAFRDLISADEALAQVRRLNRSPAAGQRALHGVPVAIKEVFDVKGLRCSWGTPIHQNRIPDNDAVAVARLRAAGAIVLGTTVSTEYAIASAGPTTNPHDTMRTPGGSSSGSAAAVATGMVPIALGTQTVGSIVRPATYCGIYGLKATHGTISTQGAMPLSPFLDDVGILARTLEDIVLAFRMLFDRDSGSYGQEAPLLPNFDKRSVPHRVYLVEGPLRRRIELPSRVALERARTVLESSGTIVSPMELPTDFEKASACLDTILCRDIATNHGGDRDQVADRMSLQFRDLVDRGREISNEEYGKAVDNAREYRNFLIKLTKEDSIILAPATDGVAPYLPEGTGAPNLQGLYSLTGLPALAVPCGTVDDLPVGVQLVAAPGREDLVLAAARAMRSIGRLSAQSDYNSGL